MFANVNPRDRRVSAIDLFCGAGGLSQGLLDAGIQVAAGIDLDPRCKFPFEANIGAQFLQRDVRDVTGNQLKELWAPGSIRLLAGCAPCQPFSSHRRGVDTSAEAAWSLLDEFGDLVFETRPEFVTMENVPRIASAVVFKRFVKTLRDTGYYVDYRVCRGPGYGLPQLRRRLVLLASRFGRIEVPKEESASSQMVTVRNAIGDLPRLDNGQTDPDDPLHTCRRLSDLNLRRIRASRPGGTWKDWPAELRAPCHHKASGGTFRSVYARMEWDKPAPTITTQSHNFGTGRFGHPEQDRAISLREAAVLQGFPARYHFVEPGAKVEFAPIGRLIGNAVPPPLAKAIGLTLTAAAESVLLEDSA
jgi:DNA (cytosine-5)-methyltransferase 1